MSRYRNIKYRPILCKNSKGEGKRKTRRRPTYKGLTRTNRYEEDGRENEKQD